MKNPSIKEYDPMVFSKLHEFHTARVDATRNAESIVELGKVICRHGLERDLGVNLLHKHFDLEPGEVLIRSNRANGSVIKALCTSSINKAVPYLWQLAQGSDGIGFYPLEFSIPPNELRRACIQSFKALCANADFLEELADTIKKQRVQNTFGIAALYSRCETILKDNETLVETTDEVKRRLILRPIARDAVSLIDSTQTLWVFYGPNQ